MSRTYRCTIPAHHSCQKIYKSEYKLIRHIAAYEAARTKKRNTGKGKQKGGSKKSLPPGIYRCKVITPRGTVCNALKLIINKKEHDNRHRAAKIASNRNIESERQYEKKLKKQNPTSLVFQTGTEGGVPDIIMYRNEKLSFYEVKPTGKGNDSLLKVGQAKWIKKIVCVTELMSIWLATKVRRVN